MSTKKKSETSTTSKKAATKKTPKRKVSARPVGSKAHAEASKNRATKIKETQREEARKKFKAIEYIRQLELAGEQLTDIIEQLDVARIKRSKLSDSKAIEYITLKAQIDILMMRRDTIKVQIDLNIRRLKFCLPEYKAIEFTDSDGLPILPPNIQVSFV